MKKILLGAFISVFLLTGCKSESNHDDDDTVRQRIEEQEALAKASREELETALSERDELLALINEINESVSEIQSVENIVSINGVGEVSKKNEITNNLAAIKSSLADRRIRLADIEKKLKDSKLSNSKLLATIDGLKKNIDEQTKTIEDLTVKLENANRKIAALDNQVDSLNSTVANVTDERNKAQNDAINQANIANECFFAVGTKKELKEHNILESGFLRKTKVLPDDFDKSYFVKADQRTLRVIPLHAKKAKVITAQPANSYEIYDQNGQKVLQITNPSSFWEVSNYVVIQID